MKIKKFKKKCIILSLILILAGGFITIAGFGTAGFNYNHLKKNATDDAWYHVIHINDDELWYGVGFGENVRIMGIGNVD